MDASLGAQGDISKRVGLATAMALWANAKAGGAAATGMISVASLAALSAAGNASTVDGTLGYVQAPLLRYFKLSRSDTQTPDGINILAATGVGVGNWLAEPNLTDTSWLNQTTWGVNPTFGLDSNQGNLANPLKTVAEFFRRLNVMTILKPALFSMSVTINGDLPATDPIQFEFYLPDAVEIDFIQTTTIVGTASTLTAVTVQNRTAPGTETNLTDAGTPANFAAGNAGFLVNDTTVPARSWIDANTGAGAANVTVPMAPQSPGGSPLTNPPIRTMAIGDAYSIQRPGQATLGAIRVHGTSFSTIFPSVRFFGFWFQPSPVLPTIYNDGTGFVRFAECRFDNVPFIAGASGSFATVTFANCFLSLAAEMTGATVANFLGGIAKSQYFLNGPCVGIFDGDHILRGRIQPSDRATVRLGNVASFGQTTLITCQGVDVTVRHATATYGSSIAWGNPTNYITAGAGDDGLRVYYTSGSIAAQLGQLPQTGLLTFANPTASAPPIFNPATAVWAVAPAGGSSLANLAQTIVGGGYGGNTFDPVTQSGFGPS